MYMKDKVFILLFFSLFLMGCYDHSKTKHDALAGLSEEQLDSLSFYGTHHYSNNYNFIVDCDSLYLCKQSPDEVVNGCPVDSDDIVAVLRNENVVVAEIQTVPLDSVDSVWINLAHNQDIYGWIHESEMLPNVVPDDPISRFINVFSDLHLILFLVFVVAIAIGYVLVVIKKQNAPIVHFRDINSFYPTLLCITVASAATFYASIQLFAPEMWRHFYYHPTLNPFEVPLLLKIFLCSVWAILIIAVAAIDDARRHLPFGEAMLYIFGMIAVCAVNYIVFSITTLYYVGYLLLITYISFALYRFLDKGYTAYLCGNCGTQMRHKGRCPKCGVENK